MELSFLCSVYSTAAFLSSSLSASALVDGAIFSCSASISTLLVRFVALVGDRSRCIRSDDQARAYPANRRTFLWRIAGLVAASVARAFQSIGSVWECDVANFDHCDLRCVDISSRLVPQCAGSLAGIIKALGCLRLLSDGWFAGFSFDRVQLEI